MNLKINLYGKIAIAILLGIPLLLLIGSLIPRRWGVSDGGQYQVCVTQLDIHTNLVLPVVNDAYDWRKQFPLGLSPQQQYVGFGWGERVWYMNPPNQPLEVVTKGARAMLWQNAAAMQIYKYDSFPDYFPYRCVKVTRSQYLALVEFIQGTFQRDGQEQLLQIPNPSSPNDFYEATGSYSFLNNSNHWVAKGLRQASVNTPLWGGFSFAIMQHLNNAPLKSKV
jgi:uncharacterized protein (TIGR02117 family)